MRLLWVEVKVLRDLEDGLMLHDATLRLEEGVQHTCRRLRCQVVGCGIGRRRGLGSDDRQLEWHLRRVVGTGIRARAKQEPLLLFPLAIPWLRSRPATFLLP